MTIIGFPSKFLIPNFLLQYFTEKEVRNYLGNLYHSTNIESRCVIRKQIFQYAKVAYMNNSDKEKSIH